jgi:tRNA dimethylallyltransferase
VLLVGGTGLYVKVLAGGLCAAPPRDSALRERLEAEERETPGDLHRRLQEVDPVAAARLHPNDRVRLVRALEVQALTGTPLSEWQARHGFSAGGIPVRTIALTLQRPELYDRINRRCREMVDAGLVDEVRDLWARGFGPDLAPLCSIGYREVGAHLRGEVDLETALELMARATRKFAKRQLTWLRPLSELRWVDAHAGAAAVLEAAGG